MYEVVIRKAARGPRDSFPTSAIVEDVSNHWCWWYFVHFQGWRVKWDKWVVEEHLLEDTKEHREMAKERMGAARSRSKKKKGKGKNVDKKKIDHKVWLEKKQREINEERNRTQKSGSGDKGDDEEALKRNQHLIDNDLEEVLQSGDALHLIQENMSSFPFALKKVMNNEHQRVTEKAIGPNGYPQRMVADLPSPIPIRTVLVQKYCQSKKRVEKDGEENLKQTKAMEGWVDMVDGLLSFFDSILPIFCLYKQEKAQLKSIMKNETLKDLKYSEIYGCEFLLRMLVRLPVLLVDYRAEPLPRPKMKNILSKVGDLIRYLVKNQGDVFRQTYRLPLENELMDTELKFWRKKCKEYK